MPRKHVDKGEADAGLPAPRRLTGQDPTAHPMSDVLAVEAMSHADCVAAVTAAEAKANMGGWRLQARYPHVAIYVDERTGKRFAYVTALGMKVVTP